MRFPIRGKRVTCRGSKLTNFLGRTNLTNSLARETTKWTFKDQCLFDHFRSICSHYLKGMSLLDTRTPNRFPLQEFSVINLVPRVPHLTLGRAQRVVRREILKTRLQRCSFEIAKWFLISWYQWLIVRVKFKFFWSSLWTTILGSGQRAVSLETIALIAKCITNYSTLLLNKFLKYFPYHPFQPM